MQKLITDCGAPVVDNQNIRPLARAPALLQDVRFFDELRA
jgi:catalase